MKKVIFLLISLLAIYGCSDSDTSTVNNEEVVIEESVLEIGHSYVNIDSSRCEDFEVSEDDIAPCIETMTFQEDGSYSYGFTDELYLGSYSIDGSKIYVGLDGQDTLEIITVENSGGLIDTSGEQWKLSMPTEL